MSNNLKELTRAHHDNAERTEFADIAVPMELEPIFRSAGIEEDLQEIEALYDLEEIEEDLTSTKEYAKHISTLVEKKDNDGLLAHLYVRHFGDAHGGQIIKRNVPGAGLMYEFEDRKDLIALTRTALNMQNDCSMN